MASQRRAIATMRAGYLLNCSTADSKPKASPCKIPKTHLLRSGCHTAMTENRRWLGWTAICLYARFMSLVHASNCEAPSRGQAKRLRKRWQIASPISTEVVWMHSSTLVQRLCSLDLALSIQRYALRFSCQVAKRIIGLHSNKPKRWCNSSGSNQPSRIPNCRSSSDFSQTTCASSGRGGRLCKISLKHCWLSVALKQMSDDGAAGDMLR